MTVPTIKPSEASVETLKLVFPLRKEFCVAVMAALEVPIQTALICQNQTEKLKALHGHHTLEISGNLGLHFFHIASEAIVAEAKRLKEENPMIHYKLIPSLVAACIEHGHATRPQFIKHFDPRQELYR